jgi:hypothetical protein
LVLQSGFEVLSELLVEGRWQQEPGYRREQRE